MNVDAHIADWALKRIQSEPKLAAEVDAYVRRVKREAELRPSPENVLRAEPVSIGLAIFSVVGISAGAVAAGIVGGAVLIGASIAVNYAISALTQKSTGGTAQTAADPPALNSQAIKYNERQAIPSKRIIYGSAQVGGSLFFEQVKPPYLYMGHLICARTITAFRRIWLGTTELAFASLAPGAARAPLAVTDQPNYPGRLLASFRLGDADQTIDPLLAADFTLLDGNFRQRGIASAVLRYHYGADFNEYTALWGQGSRPNPLFLVDGVAVPDPRNPAHILDWDPDDAAAVAAAEASWSWSNTAALVQAHYLTQRYGGRIKPYRMQWDRVGEAADWDDGLIGRSDGTMIKRHTIDGVVTLNQSPASVIAGMLKANRGFVLQSGGKVWPSSSLPRKAIGTIHDRLLTGAFDYRAAKPKRDLVNRIKMRFVAADREYQLADGPVLDRTDLRTADGEVLDGTLDLPFTMDTGAVSRAQRLEKAFLANSRLGRQINCRCDVMLLAEVGDELEGSCLNFESDLFAQANGLYQCTQWSFADNFSSIDMVLVECDPTIETDWNPATDEKPFVLASLNVS
ncbi:hypothetical protein IVA94_14905 [Bradyrhizobium sp. 156]|uniref:hypothetical protein n=1 Tax=Bradyrhizobium sp. 156 TaxID=2782630 RepID=UPI001FF99A85|nr:hypothetical protein [Bradyrhizobium sp. 156]MCK1322158.1 hypothetical protein [Bradyrhizobium sp. 156]